jgi:hypothetical protein
MAEEIHEDLRTFIDGVIVPALLDRFLRDGAPLPIVGGQGQTVNRHILADWKRVHGKWISDARRLDHPTASGRPRD